MNNWISVKDKMPKNGEQVLVAYSYSVDRQCVLLARVYHQKKKKIRASTAFWIEQASGRGLASWDITHWMPLPELPTNNYNES